jgi:hypothetical protein
MALVATNTAPHQQITARVRIDGHTVATRPIGRAAHANTALPFQVILTTSPVPDTNHRENHLEAEVSRDSEVEVDVAFGPRGFAGPADVVARRYSVARVGRQLAVQTPGLPYHRFDFGQSTWVSQNVDGQLAERETSTRP